MNHSLVPPCRDRNAGAHVGTASAFIVQLVFLLVSFCAPALAHGAEPTGDWRANVARLRALADNNAAAAREKALDMLKHLPPGATPADEARLLNIVSRAEIYMALVSSATANAQRALEISTRSGDRIGQAESNLNLSLNAINEGNMNMLTKATTASVELIEGVDRPDLVAEALLRMAMLYMRRGQVDEAITMCMQTMEIARRSNNPLALTYAHQGLGIASSIVGHYKDALDHSGKMRESARAAGSKILEGYAINGIAQGVMEAGDHAAGDALFREAIALFDGVGAMFAVNHVRFALADSYRKRGKYAEALAMYSEALEVYSKNPNRIGLWYTLSARGDLYRHLGNRASALADAERANAIAKDIGLAIYETQSAQQLAALHADKGDYKRAYELAAAAAALINRTEREKMSARVLDLAKKYETETKRRQIEDLMRRNELQQAEIRQRELQQRLLWTVLGGSVAILAGTVFFLVRLRRSHSIIRELNASLEQRVQNRTAELRQQTRYLRTLIDALPWWVWLKDTKSRYLAVNQAAAEAFGTGTEDLVGKSDRDVLPLEAALAFEADDADVMASRNSKNIEEQQITPSGRIWMETFKSAVVDDDGTVLGTVGFARDISERKVIEEAREAALLDAQRVAQLRSDFLAQISHELRTPLNGILGYAQILQNDRNLDERQAAGLNVIRQSGEHLLMLVNDILDSAKIEAGKLELYPGELPLNRFLQMITEMIAVRAEQKGIEFVPDFARDLPVAVHADEKRLRQVLLNLLSNAIKFTDRGVVTLRVFQVKPGRLRFEVKDTGIGMSEDQMKEIFQPFAQTGEVQRRLGGTGLGLAISRQFVHLMGGEIEVESHEGDGSCFSFELDLPVVALDFENPSVKRKVVGYEGARRTILVVDDLEENRAVAAGMLGALGFTMYEAGSGTEALEKVSQMAPDLILMDIVMPEMDGMETTRRLRQVPELANVPVIAVSASAAEEDRKRYLATAMNSFLAKPLVLEDLLREIESLLRIVWIHEGSDGRQAAANEHPNEFDIPPVHEMEILHRLARIGNMDEISERAAYLVRLDERYGPFADRLRALARSYQSKAILRLVQTNIEKQAGA